MKDDYHHGDLRRALLEAAEAELEDSGIEGFSLRKVARRAGVSHAAPAHHFKDARGLLTALAAQGYRRFIEMQEAREAQVPDDPHEKLLAQGLGYIDFGSQHKALFRLIFSSERPDFTNIELADASQAAFDKLANSIAVVQGRHPYQDGDAMTQAGALWAMAHGLADLIGSGRMKYVDQMPTATREQVLREILTKSIPS